ncbi:hypothetical protein [Nesterenkonia halotolerans]|uniref:Uncharacterized protein n=1 Tax=Nesterenkonia halotolerans TaxID=225325 RepID=A0ABR9J9S3_9MICC|nr:hypothetical protein [Nesterenkonia halotolerans]MBE1515747.1 hypothetical protein [Nesterenkonia halotolerans]
MSLTIFAYRTLIWMSQQESRRIPICLVPDEILPPKEQPFIRSELDERGWLSIHEESLRSDPHSALSPDGHLQGRHWHAEYPVYSAAYEILTALPHPQDGHLSGAHDAFDASHCDPVLNRNFSEDEIHGGARLLHQEEHILAVKTQSEFLSRLELTSVGAEVRNEQRVPGLQQG